MGRKRNCTLRNFFTFHVESNVSQCNICKQNFVGNYVCNLKRHLEAKHKSEYDAEVDGSNDDQVLEKKHKFSVTMGQDEAKNACIDLVTVEKLPLAVLDSKGFKTLTAQIFSGLDMPAITSRNIMGFVEEKFYAIKTKIITALENRIISLKMDTATRCNRGILGVNVQYINNDKICIRTLGLIELKTAHTSQNLCSEIKALLNEFNLRKEQIYSITTDNGRNMVKAVELMNESEVSDDDDCDSVAEDGTQLEMIAANFKIHSISSVKCAAHTLQLAVKDFMQTLTSVEFIDKARKVVKLLRTPSHRYLLTEESLPQPVLDVATRWCSTYQMLSKLQVFQDFTERHLKSSVKLSLSDWDEIRNLTETLEPAFIATEKLQSSQLFMGDFYKLWLELKLTIAASKTPYSQTLSQCIEDREDSLLSNNAVICSIYLDPRIRRVLLQKPINLMHARAQLKQLLAQILNLKRNMNPISVTSPTVSALSAISASKAPTELASQNSNTCSLLNEYLDTIEVASDEETEDDANFELLRKGYAEIDNYSPKPVSLDKDIMEYWNEKQFQYPHLHQLAKVVHSVPATQVSVERSFSALKLVLTDQRCNLSSESLSKLLFVKLNNN